MRKKQLWYLLLFVSLFAGCGQSGMDAPEHMQRAEEFYKLKDYRSAVIELKNVLQKDQSMTRARYLLGAIYVDAGDGESAERELRKVLNPQESNYSQTAVLLARSLLMQKKYSQLLDEGIVDQNISTEDKPDLLALKGEALVGLNKPRKARDNFDAALAINHKSVFANVGLAKLALLEGDLEKASKYIEDVLSVDDRNAEALLLKGRVATLNSQFPAAENNFKLVLKNESRHVANQHAVQARLGLVAVLTAQQKDDEALVIVNELLKLLPRHPLPMFMRAKIAYENGDQDVARKYLLQVRQLAPDHEPTMLMLGAVNYAMGLLEQADQLLSRYVVLQPDNNAARKMLASLRLKQQQHEQVVDLLSPALKDASNDAELLALIGAASSYSGNVKEGVQYLKSAIEKDPDNHFARTELAVSFLSQGDLDSAIKELEQAKGVESGSDRAGVLLVLIYLREKRFDQALVAAEQLVSRAPDQPVLNNLLGTVYLNKGDIQSARQYLTQALVLKSDYYPAAINLARLEVSEGKMESALLVADRIKKASPDTVMGFELMGDLLMSAKRYDDALAEYKSGLQKEQRSTLAIKAHGAYMKMNKVKQAQAFLERWLDEFSDDNRARLVLIGAYTRLNDNDAAIKHYLLILEKEPDNLIALNDLAWLYSQVGDSRALEFAERAYALNKENASVLDTLGWILVQQGDMKRGMPLLTEAHQRAPQMPDIQFHVAVGYEKLGERDKARKLLDDILMAAPGSFASYKSARELRDKL